MVYDFNAFLERYPKIHYWDYRRNAKEVEKTCRKELDEAEIPYLISYRIKKIESLKTKLKNRQAKDPTLVLTEDTIMANVFDIAGVRIAVYLPHHKEEVHKIIRSKCGFHSAERDKREFGNDNTIEPRYKATHWIVKMNQMNLHHPVEIQVMLVLESSFAHIEHDYKYKKVHADISPEEQNALKAFGKAVDLSNYFLNELSGLRKRRLDQQFQNIYDLGGFLSTWCEEISGHSVKDIGPLDALWELLQKTESPSLNSRGELRRFLTEHNPLNTSQQNAGPASDIGWRPTVSIMYQVVQAYRAMFQPAPRAVRTEENYGSMLEVIMSTILWLSDFFPPEVWEDALLKGLNKAQSKQLLWLGTWKPHQFKKMPNDFNTSAVDCEHVENLWELLKTHPSPAVKLAWDISDSVVLQNIAEKTSLFNRAFETLGRRLKDLDL